MFRVTAIACPLPNKARHIRIDTLTLSSILPPMKTLPRLIAILGPTASGKSTLGIQLAQKLDGEIISCDSRQIFRRLDIGTGKVTKEEQAQVPHHLLDITDPGDAFSAAHFQNLAFKAIDSIISRNKTPLLVGGTFLYAYAVIDNYQFSNAKPDMDRRKELANKSIDDLRVILSEAQSAFDGQAKLKDLAKDDSALPSKILGLHLPASTSARFDQDNGLTDRLNASDSKNPRRLIRAIEKLEAGEPLKQKKHPQKYDPIILAIDVPRDALYQKIDQRVDGRVKEGMIQEVEQLLKSGVSEEWLINLGLEYKWITECLQGKCAQQEMISRLKTAIHAFARRQLTWLRRDKRIIWVKNHHEAQTFLDNALAP